MVLHMLDEMARHTHGSTMKHITKRKFEALDVSIPSKQEQRRIVEKIQEAFDRLDEIQKLRVESHREASAIFQSLLAVCFHNLSEECRVATINDVALETKYGTSRRCNTDKRGTPILRIPNISGGVINVDDLKFCDQLSETELSKILLRDGDLLIVRSNGSRDLVGRCAVFNNKDQPYAYASYLIRIRPNLDKVNPQFLAFFLESTTGRDALAERRRTSAGQYNLNSKSLRSIPFPCPPLSFQLSIVEQMVHQKQVVNKVMAVHSDIQDQDMALRQTILHRAFTGEL